MSSEFSKLGHVAGYGVVMCVGEPGSDVDR